jgi:hypothetical protein
MWKVAVCFAILLCAPYLRTTASAQPAPTSNYTSIEAIGEKPVQLGYYASANKNCTPAPLPTIRVVDVPKFGTFTIRRAKLKTSKIAGCPGIELDAEVAFYQPRAGGAGIDKVVYEVTTSEGEVSTYDVTIAIKVGPEPGK